MFHTATIELPTTKKAEMIDVTKRVRAIVAASNVQFGLCSIFCGHTTGAITINENTDPDVQTDILNALERAVPQKGKYYKHEEGNAPAHAKAATTSKAARAYFFFRKAKAAEAVARAVTVKHATRGGCARRASRTPAAKDAARATSG